MQPHRYLWHPPWALATTALVATATAAPAPAIPVTGRVVSPDGEPVAGAVITADGGRSARTDRDGRFRIEAPPGDDLLVESAAHGLALATVTGEDVGDIVLGDGPAVETIRVIGEAPAPAPLAARLDREELQRVPGTGGDVVRTLTVMPSVVNLQVPLGFTGVPIRGSSPQDSKVLIDGFEVPLLFHDLGFRAIVPAEAIASLDFMPGGFDVSYGRASSGMVLLTTRPGGDRRSTQTELSVIDGGLLAQGPAGADTRYMFALRRSTIDFVLPSLIPASADLSLTTVPRYWDGQLRIDHRLSPRWGLTLSSFGADDVLELVTSKDEDARRKRFYSLGRFARTTASARYQHGPWQVDLALSGLAAHYTLEVGLHQRADVRNPSVTARTEVTRKADEALGLAHVEWRTGAEVQVTRWNIEMAFGREVREGDANPTFDPDDTSVQFDGRVWTPDVAGWTSVAANLDPRLRLTTGVRVETFARPGEVAVQPRGELEVRLAPAWKLRLAAGAYRRPPEYNTELFSESVRSERARQTIAGVQWEPAEGTRVQAAAYYTDRTGLIRADEMGTLTNSGRGTTYGGELLATHRAGPRFAWLSYGYAHSTRVDAPGQPARLFDFDQPHSLNAAASWRRGRWQLGGRFQVYSGLPYTPALGGVLDSDRNVYQPINAAVNSARAPIHHQLDLRVDYGLTLGPIAATAFLDVQNVYMNDSVVTYFYNYDYSQRTAFRSLPLIPSLGLRGVL